MFSNFLGVLLYFIALIPEDVTLLANLKLRTRQISTNVNRVETNTTYYVLMVLMTQSCWLLSVLDATSVVAMFCERRPWFVAQTL